MAAVVAAYIQAVLLHLKMETIFCGTVKMLMKGITPTRTLLSLTSIATLLFLTQLFVSSGALEQLKR